MGGSFIWKQLHRIHAEIQPNLGLTKPLRVCNKFHMAVTQRKQKPGFVEQAMAFGNPNLNPKKAIFAVREVVHTSGDIPIIYKTRGMACAVEVGGKKRLVTWHNVINEDDKAKPIRLHRCSKEFFNDQKNYRFEMSQVEQIESCSFISLLRGDAPTPKKDFEILKLKVPESDEKSKDVFAYSFTGCKDTVKFTFKYDYDRGKHELNSPVKDCICEKSFILGSPIITDKDQVIGVVGEDLDGRLFPYFLTDTEVGK